ncbi:MAG: serine--tRNA ligase [Nitrososphaeria archaeon]|nr:serine--tRNA ligase [Nitrososphaeria archaeon]
MVNTRTLRIMLNARIELSSAAEVVEQEIRESIDALEKSLEEAVERFGREEVAQILSHRIGDRVVEVSITSGRGVRAHEALLRFKNILAQKIGSKRIGVRRIFIESLEIKFKEGHVGEEKARELLKGLAEVREESGDLIVVFRNLTDRDLRERVIDRAIRFLRTEETRPEGKKLAPFGTVLREGPAKRFKMDVDVAVEAEKRGWVKRYPGKGQWIYTPPMASLIRAMAQLIIERVARPLGFHEWIFPRLVPMEVFKRLTTYIEHLPDGVFYVCVPPRDPSAFEEFKREYMLRREIRTDLLKQILGEPEYIMEAIQCTAFYQYFSGEFVRLEDLPIKAYELLGGWTWRNEAGGVEGLVRTNEFWRLEMVFIGSPDDVTEIRNKVMDLTIELADKCLDLEWRVVAGAPFYLSPHEASKRLIDVSDVKRIPTLDLEIYLPYRGPRESAEWLEVTAASVHRDFYVKNFKIKEAKERELWTGCVGHGLSRWAAGFLARHGFEFDDWPEAIKEIIGTLPNPPKLLD